VSTLDDSFTELLGRLPTDAERQDLFRARDTLNIKNNDALWPLLVMLRHYETIYSKVPALITQTIKEAVKRARSAAEAELKAASASIQADLARSVADTAARIADRRAGTKRGVDRGLARDRHNGADNRQRPGVSLGQSGGPCRWLPDGPGRAGAT
jgi:hypothetical protein